MANEFVGELKNGGTIETETDAGYHILTFKSTLKKLASNATFNVVINTEDEIVVIKTHYDMNGQYVAEYDDNKPHIPEFSKLINSDNNELQNSNNNNTSGIRCPHCGSYDIFPISETTTTGKDFNTGNACCGYLLCGPLGLLLGTAGKGKQVSTSTCWVCKICGYKFKL